MVRRADLPVAADTYTWVRGESSRWTRRFVVVICSSFRIVV